MDPCNAPKSLTQASAWPAEIYYTLTDDPKDFVAPAFVIDPDYCPFDVTCTISAIPGGTIATDRSPGSNPPSFILDKFDSLSGLGSRQTIRCTATSKTDYPPVNPGDNNPITSPPGVTDIVPKNPCIDPNFVEIQQLNPPLVDVLYNVGQGPLAITPSHADFTLVTRPRATQHNLCGSIKVEPCFEDKVLVGGEPVTYNSNTNTFTINTSDQSFAETIKEYCLKATLTNWPPTIPGNTGVTQRKASGRIEFGDVCAVPTNFAATPQDNISDNYSGNLITWNLNQFNISPAQCKIVYDCVSILRKDNPSAAF